jgi:choline dehydrogenase-like flavoprotein
METWDFAHCLPYFKRMENCLAAARDDPWRGHSGPLVLERGPATNPLFGAFFEAVQQAGYPLTEDVNGYRQEGFAAFDRNVSPRPAVAARAYPGQLPAQPRSHPRAVTGCRSTARAVGVGQPRRGRRGPAAAQVEQIRPARWILRRSDQLPQPRSCPA